MVVVPTGIEPVAYALGKRQHGTGGVEMADSGSIDGRPEASEDGAGRASASELRPVDAAGREWPETTEEGLMADLDVVEREAREAREEAARLRAERDDAYAQIQEIADAVLDADCGLPPLADAVRGLTAHRNELRAQVAALEAALRQVVADSPTERPVITDAMYGEELAWAMSGVSEFDVGQIARAALSGGTSALDAVVSAAVAARVAAIRARVEALARMEAVGRYDMQTCSDENDEHGYWHAADVISAIDATEGGA